MLSAVDHMPENQQASYLECLATAAVVFFSYSVFNI